MEERSLASSVSGDHASSLEGPYGERRRRALEVLTAQDAYLQRLEQTITEQLQTLANEVAQSVERVQTASSEQNESEAIAALQTQFNTLKQQFDAVDAECEQHRKLHEAAQLELARTAQELRIRDTLLKETQDKDEQRRVELATLREQLADAQAQLNAVRARQQAQEQEIAAERERHATLQEETKVQRRRIAREFKQQRSERLAELESRKAELETLSARQHHALEAQVEQLQEELAQVRQQHTEHLSQLATAPQETADPEFVRQLRDECDLLHQKLAIAEGQLNAQRELAEEDDPRSRDDLQRRFEMAVDEVRELKRLNADLENKLKNRGGDTSSPALSSTGGLDWEAQKQRLLASLEADGDYDEPVNETERLSIEEAIRVTDQALAQKDQEITRLRHELENNLATTDVSSEAINELLDRDEIIQAEREKLKQLQAEWREKIGEAEIEISVQRAKLARERAELEDKMRQFQLDQDNRSFTDDSNESTGKPSRGKWLARLGLKDLDDK